MENKPEIVVLYIDKENGNLHKILLNDLELNQIASQIAEIFERKNSDVLVEETNLKLYAIGVDTNVETNSSQVQ